MVILYKYDVIFYAVLLYLPLRDEWIEMWNTSRAGISIDVSPFAG